MRAKKHCGIQGCTVIVPNGKRCEQHKYGWNKHNHTRSVPYALQQACFKLDNWTCWA